MHQPEVHIHKRNIANIEAVWYGMAYLLQAVLLTQRRKHGAVDLELAKLRVAVEEFDEVDLREWLQRVIITTELNLHHQVLHLASALQHRADGAPAPLDAAQREVVQLRELPHLDMIHST